MYISACAVKKHIDSKLLTAFDWPLKFEKHQASRWNAKSITASKWLGFPQLSMLPHIEPDVDTLVLNSKSKQNLCLPPCSATLKLAVLYRCCTGMCPQTRCAYATASQQLQGSKSVPVPWTCKPFWTTCPWTMGPVCLLLAQELALGLLLALALIVGAFEQGHPNQTWFSLLDVFSHHPLPLLCFPACFFWHHQRDHGLGYPLLLYIFFFSCIHSLRCFPCHLPVDPLSFCWHLCLSWLSLAACP